MEAIEEVQVEIHAKQEKLLAGGKGQWQNPSTFWKQNSKSFANVFVDWKYTVKKEDAVTMSPKVLA